MFRSRDERENARANATRKGAGRARVRVMLVSSITVNGKRVRGATAVAQTNGLSRDERKAFKCFCERNGISFLAVEFSRENGTLPTAFQVWGEPVALRLLWAHRYVVGWLWVTDMKPARGVGKLARPTAEVPPDDPTGSGELQEQRAQFSAENEAYARAERWISAHGLSDHTREELHVLRESLAVWFLTCDSDPTAEQIAAFCESVEWE
jgi:hypothetical protein